MSDITPNPWDDVVSFEVEAEIGYSNIYVSELNNGRDHISIRINNIGYDNDLILKAFNRSQLLEHHGTQRDHYFSFRWSSKDEVRAAINRYLEAINAVHIEPTEFVCSWDDALPDYKQCLFSTGYVHVLVNGKTYLLDIAGCDHIDEFYLINVGNGFLHAYKAPNQDKPTRTFAYDARYGLHIDLHSGRIYDVAFDVVNDKHILYPRNHRFVRNDGVLEYVPRQPNFILTRPSRFIYSAGGVIVDRINHPTEIFSYWPW